MAILCLIYFGYSSVTGATLELSPDMDMPMLMIMTTYSGASPEDVNELITTEIEDQAASLSGLKSISSTSSEGSSMVMLEYEYGTDIDEAYDDLKKQIDIISTQLPDDAEEPVIMEMSMDAQADITLSINNSQEEDLYSYVNNEIAPEFEKISEAAEVSVRGGSEQYVKIELIREKVEQYQLSMSSISEDIGDANLSYPAGDIQVGSQELSVSTRMDYDTVELLKEIPLTTPDGSTVYLEDVANVYTTYEDSDSIARYNGEDTISLSITKQQSSSTVDLSESVKETRGGNHRHGDRHFHGDYLAVLRRPEGFPDCRKFHSGIYSVGPDSDESDGADFKRHHFERPDPGRRHDGRQLDCSIGELLPLYGGLGEEKGVY